MEMGLQDVWGPLLAWDLFLGGAGAAAYVIGVAALWLGGKYLRLAKPGIFSGPPLVAIGALLLLLELGNPTRFYLGFLRPGSSMMSVGILIISVFIVLGFLHILFSLFPKIGVKEGALRWLGLVAAVLGVGIMLYTGLLLGLVKAVPFWNTPMLPLLFLVSALISGAGVVILIAGLQRWVAPKAVKAEEVGESVGSLVPTVVLLLVVELLVLFLLVFLTNSSNVVAAESAKFLVSGAYATAFWVGVVVVGVALPLVLVLWVASRRGKMGLGRVVDVSTLAAFCLLVGGLILRYAVVAAGANVSSLL
jgi:polysulfide reductase chain C